MTATSAAAPASAPIAPSPPRAAPQAATDRFAFAGVLDSLPGAEAKAVSSIAQDRSPTSNEPQQGESSPEQPDVQSTLYGGAILSALPFALLCTTASHESAAATADPPLLTPALTAGPGLEDMGPSNAASSEPGNSAAARLVGERTYHFSPATSGGVIAQRLPPAELPATDAPPAASSQSDGGPIGPPALASLPMQRLGLAGKGASFAASAANAGVSAGAISKPFAAAAPSGAATSGPAPIAPVTGSSPNPSASMIRAAGQGPANTGRKSAVVASPPVTRVAGSAVPSAPAEPSGKPADDPPLNPSPSGAQWPDQGGVFGAQATTSLAAGPSFGLDDLPAGAADIAPPANALPVEQTSAAKEIDVDLSPGGLENVSMTMRLAGDKLSVVIRAASSQTSGSIEGARDAIVDRLAAIGQPLNSLIIQQVGVNADANTNGNAAPDEGSTTGERQSGQSAGEQANSNDPSASRRGASGDLRF